MMSERAAEVGGSVSITSEPGCGTSVEATVPLEHPRAA
jgi:signal transduction histidine kinase